MTLLPASCGKLLHWLQQWELQAEQRCRAPTPRPQCRGPTPAVVADAAGSRGAPGLYVPNALG